MGSVSYARGQYQEALGYFRKYSELAARLTAIDPRNADWQTEVADADTNLATLLLKEHQPFEALTVFQRALAIEKALALKTPGDHDLSMDLARPMHGCRTPNLRRGLMGGP